MHRATHAAQQSVLSIHVTSTISSGSGFRQHGHVPSMSLLAIRAIAVSCPIKQGGGRKLCEFEVEKKVGCHVVLSGEVIPYKGK